VRARSPPQRGRLKRVQPVTAKAFVFIVHIIVEVAEQIG
jgi:hypothetical protein